QHNGFFGRFFFLPRAARHFLLVKRRLEKIIINNNHAGVHFFHWQVFDFGGGFLIFFQNNIATFELGRWFIFPGILFLPPAFLLVYKKSGGFWGKFFFGRYAAC